MKIIATRPCAFGNGTREKGFVFAEVEFKGDNKAFQLLKELRAKVEVPKLTTAKVKLSDGVTARELQNALANPSIIQLTVPAPKFSLESFAKLKASEAIELAGKLGPIETKAALEHELSQDKPRKTVLDALGHKDQDDWSQTAVADLAISDEAKSLLVGAGLKTIADVKAHGDQNQGIKVEGFTPEMVKEFALAVKELGPDK